MLNVPSENLRAAVKVGCTYATATLARNTGDVNEWSPSQDEPPYIVACSIGDCLMRVIADSSGIELGTSEGAEICPVLETFIPPPAL